MGDSTEVELEMVRPKDDPSQLWIREVVEEGAEYKNDWQVNFVHKDYQYLMDEGRHYEIPHYAMEGLMIVTNDGTVAQAYEKHPNFDEAKIASCELKKT